MTLTCDKLGLTGIYFIGQKHYPAVEASVKKAKTEITERTIRLLDEYFQGKNPNFDIPLHIEGTSFERSVWRILMTVPYGKTITYGDIAEKIAQSMGINKMSAQAVGGAVGRNKISIIVPCHRVIAANGKLTGYAAGISVKKSLLELKGACFKK